MPSSENARELRRAQNPTETRLWYYLRARRLGGFKFRRQHPIGQHIVDFCCVERRLVVELDGGHHSERERADLLRTDQLEAAGYRVLRFWNDEVGRQVESVLARIVEELDKRP